MDLILVEQFKDDFIGATYEFTLVVEPRFDNNVMQNVPRVQAVVFLPNGPSSVERAMPWRMDIMFSFDQWGNPWSEEGIVAQRCDSTMAVLVKSEQAGGRSEWHKQWHAVDAWLTHTLYHHVREWRQARHRLGLEIYVQEQINQHDRKLERLKHELAALEWTTLPHEREQATA